MLKIYCDGGSRGNPGPAASAFVVLHDETLVHKESKFLGSATNNIAEYNALVMALEYLKKTNEDGVVNFVLDSELVTKQLNGVYKIKNENLKSLFLKAKQLEREVSGNINYEWHPREHNKLADQLVNEELDRQKK